MAEVIAQKADVNLKRCRIWKLFCALAEYTPFYRCADEDVSTTWIVDE